MKSVLISIRPYWIFLIIAKAMGWITEKEKTIEVRKTYPKAKDWNKKVILYCTKDYESLNKIPREYQMLMRLLMGKVIGEFVCDKLVWVVSHPRIFAGYDLLHEFAIKEACLMNDEAQQYSNGKDVYGWHISDIKIYDEPKEITEFYKCGFEDAYNEWEYYDIAGVNGIMPKSEDWKIKCPPQSWCYVEE